MGWSIAFDDNWNRDIGYGVPAVCDHPGCNEEIDRGLSDVCCDEQPYGGAGCGLYFCDEHHSGSIADPAESDLSTMSLEEIEEYDGPYLYGLCERCVFALDPRNDISGWEPFAAKPDVAEWINHKLTDESWAEWRAANPKQVAQLKQQIASSDITGESR